MLLEKSIYLDLAIDRDPLIISPEKSVWEAIGILNRLIDAVESADRSCDRRLLEARTSCILIVDGERLMGVFSQQDVLRLVEKQVDFAKLPIAAVLATETPSMRESQVRDLESILDLLERKHCRHLPILDDSDRPIGVATLERVLFAKNKLTEDFLTNVESQKRAVLTAIPDLIYRVSVDGIYLECFSSNYVADLFASDFDPIGKHFLEVLPIDLAHRKLTAIQQVISTGEIQTFEQQWLINGKVQYEEVQIVPVNDREVLTIIRNISDRKQAEEALRESEMRFRSVFDNAAVGISLAAPNGKHIAVNQSLCHMLGYSESELQALTFQEITHPDDLKIDLFHYQKLLANEIDSFHIEKRFRHQSGQFIWGLLSVSIVRDAQDRPMYDIALIQNINELKMTQQALHRLNQELELRIEERTADLAESETRKREILNAIPDLLLRLKTDGTCLDCIMPHIPDKEAFIPIKHHISEVLAPDIIANQSKASQLAIATGEVQIYEHKLQKHNEWVYEEVRISPCGNDEVLVLVRNITDRKRAEAALQLSNERLTATNRELERLTRLKDEFLAAMSHELRTPLNAILGISEGLIEKAFGELNQRQQGSLKTIQKSGQHLLELINDILDVAKIESGMFTLELRSVSVRDLCESSLSFVKHQAAQKNIQLNLEIDTNVPKVIVIDERRMRQLLINLLSNAVKFTPKNGKVLLKTKLTHNELYFSVSDNGIGIPQEDLNRLFQPFVQIDSSLSRQYSGTGLGLNLVKKLAELHGGQVNVKSKVGEGSCFTVSLPYEDINS
ncbi:PAS domain S-box protein [Pseudanabaena sp. 'Roaring Creek']|uniref:PAS domain S-box protein n=1 Tax=Pseudanabaena sp. 'Roaring Creek' TaxID=1681830 RepID=UPI0006D79EDD|nr:PAS domain S-box protein [Pseudanabaena sp. 'Roaring Creek']